MTIVHYTPRCSIPTSFPLKQNINNGITYTKNGMPQKFNGADGGSTFALGRKRYINTTLANEKNNIVSLEKNKHSCSCNTRVCSCAAGKYINVQSSDQYIERIKNRAIGKGSMPGQTNNFESSTLSFKSQSFNTTNNALRRCRNGGCVAPAKKGARP